MTLRLLGSTVRLGVIAAALFICASLPARAATPTSTLDVSITSGPVELPQAAVLQLKIYEQGPLPRIVTLPRARSWPASATRVVRVHLDRPLDPARVRRFSIAYREPSSALPPWEVSWATVEWDTEGHRERLLAATVAGVIAPGRDLASDELETAQLACSTDADCDDGRTCNGAERCDPHNRAADVRGCVAGHPLICPVNQICVEHQGCRGASEARPAAAATVR